MLTCETFYLMLPTAQDAKKMPPLVQPRAEKRKLIEEELNCSLKVFVNLFVKEAIILFKYSSFQSPQRRRVRLGSGALSLAGPPLRFNSY